MPDASADQLFDLADQIALISSELLRFRLRQRASLSATDRTRLEAAEVALDQACAQMRAQGITALARQSKAARDEVASTAQAAEAQLRRLKKIERVLEIAASALGLAQAAMAGKPKDITQALGQLKTAISTTQRLFQVSTGSMSYTARRFTCAISSPSVM